MKKVTFFCLISLLYSSSAFSEYKQHLCERKSIDIAGFKDISTAESWHPKTFTIKTNIENKTASKNNKVVDLWIRNDNKRMEARFKKMMEGGFKKIYIIFFLPNGEIHTELSDTGGYKSAGGAVYKCSGWTKK